MSPRTTLRRAVSAGAAALVVSAIAAPMALAGDGGGKNVPANGHGKPIRGQYIVTVEHGHDPKGVSDHAGANAKFVYHEALNGFAAQLTDRQVEALKRNPNVKAIELDQEVSADSVQTSDLPWGLDRIDQRYRPLSGSMTYSSTGAGVYAYVIDSGIQTSHPQFGGRAQTRFDAFGGDGQDCNGHGTHVAGTIGGATYGVAKSVQLRAVRVLDCTGHGSISGIIAGIDWVRLNAAKPAVANISIGAPKSDALNAATTNLVNSGVFAAVSAGNDGVDACGQSPASALGTFTVAASDSNDNRAVTSSWASNYGACVDAYAPGLNVKSAWLNSTTNVISGTSMATPHVSGIIADAKSAYGDAYTSAAWVQWLKDNSTPNIIGGNVAGTYNRFVFKGTL